MISFRQYPLRFRITLALSTLLFAVTLLGRTTNTASLRDSQALAIAAQAQFALTAGSQIKDIRLSGTAFLATAPREGNGAIVLEIADAGLSRIDFEAASISEVRNSSSNAPIGSWKGSDGSVHQMATHNCWLPSGWFLPYGFITGLLQTNASVSYIARETHNQVTVDHLRYSLNLPGKTPAVTALLNRLTTIDLFLDADSHLPLFVDFNIHPDDDVNADLPVEVWFSDYRQVNGIQVPFRIRQFLQNTLHLDATIEDVSLNSGLPESEFSLN